METTKPDEILEFWFGDALASPEQVDLRSKLWFSRNDAFDRQIQQHFGSLPERAARSELDEWRGEAFSALALILVLDQFPRNLYRHSARAFEFDPLAREVALESIAGGFDQALHPVQLARYTGRRAKTLWRWHGRRRKDHGRLLYRTRQWKRHGRVSDDRHARRRSDGRRFSR